jgi:hypothetical protein
MLQIPIDVSFLDSCLESFLNTRVFTPEIAQFFPLTYETINSDFIRPVREKKKNKSSKFSSYTGFIASFYSTGKLEIFGYLQEGILKDFIKLEFEKLSGFYEYHAKYLEYFASCTGKYVDGQSIESPFLWGHEDIITTIDFSEWVKQEIHYVTRCGIDRHSATYPQKS